MKQNFHPTRWTLVQRSLGQSTAAKQALSELCDIYYQPVHLFILYRVKHPQDAEDLTHAFFEQLLVNNTLQNVDSSMGKFRNYLLGSVKNFILLQKEKSTSQKRGGGSTSIHIDDVALPTDDNEEHVNFDRQWAKVVITTATSNLKAEWISKGKEQHFELIKPWLDGGSAGDLEITAKEMNMTPNALKVYIHRTRVRFRILVRQEIESTLPAEGNVTQELNHLISVLVKSQ